jgi:hypothetical protein
MSRPKGFERGGFGGSSDSLEDRHLKPAAETGKTRTIMVSNRELNRLRINNGKGILKKYLYGEVLAVGEIITLQGEQEMLRAKVAAIPEGMAVGKNKSTPIEVELIDFYPSPGYLNFTKKMPF